LVQTRFPSNANYTLQRFKAWGDDATAVVETTMNPARTLKQVEIQDAAERMDTPILMGDRVAPRRH